MDESSSMDGSLNSSSEKNYDGDEPSEIDHSGLSSGVEDSHDIKKMLYDMRRSTSIDKREDNIVEKLSKLIKERGYSLPSLDYGRLLIMVPNPEEVEDWMESVMSILIELFERLDKQRNVVVNVNEETQRKEVNQEALYTQIEKLQELVQDLQQKEIDLKRKLLMKDEATSNVSKDGRKLELEYKKKIKNLEGIIQEHERRYRVKELEFDKLKKKLATAAEKDAESMQKTKEILQVLNTRDLSLIDQSFSEMGIGLSPTGKKSSQTNNKSVNNSLLSARSNNGSQAGSRSRIPTSSSNGNNSSSGNRLTKDERIENLMYALKAMESDRRELLSRNLELELQVKSLVQDLNTSPDHSFFQNAVSTNNSAIEDSLEARVTQSSPRKSKEKAPAVKTTYTGTMTASETLREQELLDHFASEKQELQQMIDRQRLLIEELRRKHDIDQAFQQENVRKIETLRTQLQECHQMIENLKVELEARPTMRQWTSAQREIHDLERKVHDLVVMRKESDEIDAWRKHLSTSERIRIDKRNHELGLWLLDSLPKTVMKEHLQTICRELDLSDLSEIPQAIQKLKTVVRAVPRMERFIAKITAFVFDRTVLLNDRLGLATPDPATHETLEKTMQQLQRWWMLVQKCLDLEAFRESVLFELFRANELLHGDHYASTRPYGDPQDTTATQAGKRLSHPSSSTSSSSFPLLSPAQETALQLRLREFWDDHGRQDWLLRDPAVLLTQLRDMADLQTEVLQSRAAIAAAETFVQERPDLLVHRILQHIQYLLEVKSIDGILPTVNKLYVFSEEMKNFLAALRSTMGKDKNTPVAIVTDEVLSLLTRLKIKQINHVAHVPQTKVAL